jgi:hypothetical protein
VYQPSNDTPIFHWSPGAPEDAKILASGKRFGVGDIITIGAFPVNQGCPFSQLCNNKILPRLNTTNQPRALGTGRKSWDREEVQVGLSVSQYVGGVANVTWKKTPEKTIKHQIKHIGWNLDTLDAPWGLLISVCTGVAQRVPLREVIAEVMPAMVAAMESKPDGWTQLAQRYDVAEQLRNPSNLKFRHWYNDCLQKSDRDALRLVTNYAVEILSSTGVSSEGKLVVACPSEGDSWRCIHMPQKQNLALAGILKDSHECATFVCTTARCIQTQGYRCQNSQHPKWQDRAQLLITTVCQYQLTGEEPERLYQQRLQDGGQYWMWGGHQRFTADVRHNPGSQTLVMLTKSLCREPFARLFAEHTSHSCYIKLLENHQTDDYDAEEVFVLSKV